LNGTNSKYILKQVAGEILPPEIVNRPKHTFDVPIEKWLKTDLRDLTLGLISDGRVAGEKLFNTNYILKDLWPGVEANRPGYGRQVWTLLNLALWAERYQVRVIG
jgi:asparagine synthase (glutamine-hydrolysing)